MNYKKRTSLKFLSIKFLAKYLDHSKEFLLDIPSHQRDFFIYMPDKPVPGKPGKTRTFYAPTEPYKKLLKIIDKRILSRISMPDSFQGGIKGFSPRTNAEKHLAKHELIKVDIKDFFPSINPEFVYKAFLKLGMSKINADLLTQLTTVKYPKPQLPQGFPTSPKISILVLRNFEKRIHKLAKQFGWDKSFWIDDISISGNFPVNKFKKLVLKILKDEGFLPHPDKTTGMKKGDRKQRLITGIVVNKKLNLPREKRRLIEQELYYIKRFGIKHHLIKKGGSSTEMEIQKFKLRLFGKINNIKNINPQLGAKYQKQFDSINWGYPLNNHSHYKNNQ